MVMYKDDNILESLQYELYMFNAELNTVKTKLCIDEATIISKVREMYCTEEYVEPFTHKDAIEVNEDGIDMGYPELIESIKESSDEYIREGKLTDKVQSRIMGVHNTGKYDVLKSQVTKAIRKAKNDKRLDAIQRELNIAIANMDKVLKDKNPKYPNELKAYIRWLKYDTKELIKARRTELKHMVSESSDVVSEGVRDNLGLDVFKNITVNAKSTGTNLKLRPELLRIARNSRSMKHLHYLKVDLRMGIETYENIKRNKPELSRVIDEHINWLNTEYRQAIEDREKELKNQINESALNDITVIQEGALEKLRKIWEAIIAKLKEIWNNFFGKAKQREDKITWLNDNKNTILNNQFKGEKELPKFWERGEYYRSLTQKIPQFDYKALKGNLESDDAFIAAYFQDLKQDGKPYADVLRGLLYGEKQTVKDGQMPIAKMYQFCTNTHKQIVGLLDKSFKSCVSGAEKFKSDISSGKIVAESVACLDRYFYSYILEAVLYEADLSKDTSKDNNDAQTNNTNKGNNSDADEKLKKDESDSVKKDKQDAMEAQNKAQRCITICTNINGILMKACDDTFDTYFAILEEHAIRNGAKKRKLIKINNNKK